jgi:hypothetical protein
MPTFRCDGESFFCTVKFEGEFRYLKKASALSATSAILLFFIVSDLKSTSDLEMPLG